MDGNIFYSIGCSIDWVWLMKYVISLGGSVLGEESLSYLSDFISLIKKNGSEFVIFTGGGKTARDFINRGQKMGLSDVSLDWIGIYATRLNAIFLKGLFGDDCSDSIVTDPTRPIHFSKKIVVAAGWKPGWSTDYDAVLVAKQIGASMVINITNISHVYSKDPKKFKEAKKLETVSWKDFQAIVGDKWSPGLNMPFDPIASKEAASAGLRVVIINNEISKLEAVLSGKKFEGTLIS
jgi:uridylate kinase